jgi:ATP-dependent exoDNAse (exonuclease V) beta subunit
MEASRALYRVLAMIVGLELRIACQRTRGKNRLLRTYEAAHRQLVRGVGRLAFDDLPLLLAGRLNPGQASDWAERWEQLRMDMEFRLNARYDHWLFDEFQDTSRRQWRVVQNLVEEVLQDPEGSRSFFAVGDLKQSIYLWREAEPELFTTVEDRHHAKLDRRPLNVSWRSSPMVLDMVNDMFGNAAALRAELPDAMLWTKESEVPFFEIHSASATTRSLPGHAALLTVPTGAERDEALVALLRRVRPRERGLTCAVLTRKNDEAQRLAALLRRELNCDVLCESEEAVATDNAVTLALLSVFQLGAHPQDRYAWNHVRMTPLVKWLKEHRMSAERVGEEVRRGILRGGFLVVSEQWAARLHSVFPELDAFGEWRLRQFLEMCARFDESGSRDIDAFQQYARDYRIAATGAAQALQVMTIHKSKGLEFDLVILPDLQTTVLDDAADARLLTARDDSGEMKWILDRPSALILEWDGTLVPEIGRLKSRAAFEGLCRLYVAMTRARQGLYLISNDDSKATVRSEDKLLRNILGPHGSGETSYDLPHPSSVRVVYERGPRDWFENYALRESKEVSAQSAAPPKPLGDLLRKVNQPVQRRTPSGEESFHLRGREFLTPQRESSRRLGTVVHELFEAIEWLEGQGTEACQKQWRTLGLDLGQRFNDASALVTRALENAEVRQFFTNIDARRIAWRERRFDLLQEKEWITGTLDRVVLERDAKGAWTQATVVDFKTDSATSVEEAREKAKSYAPQLDLYNEAVQRLTGLPSDKIKTVLVFVAGPWVVQLGG